MNFRMLLLFVLLVLAGCGVQSAAAPPTATPPTPPATTTPAPTAPLPTVAAATSGVTLAT